jgi:hypothetical protein
VTGFACIREGVVALAGCGGIGEAMTGLAFFAALAFYGFHTARAGQPIFSGAVLDN